MATLPKQEGTHCNFNIAWIGKCKTLTDNGWCSEHEPLMCCVCGKKATHNCDRGMGGLICGCNLCDNCIHSPNEGIHITKEEAKKIELALKKEEEAKISSRESPSQRVGEDNAPLNLLELLKNPEGYSIQKLYYLELVHGLAGFFPAEIPAQKRMVITTDKEILKKVWTRLERRKSRMGSVLGYVGNGVAYPSTDEKPREAERTEPIRILTEEEFITLCANEPDDTEDPAFRWALGLFGGGTMHEELFQDMVAKA